MPPQAAPVSHVNAIKQHGQRDGTKSQFSIGHQISKTKVATLPAVLF
jgi:hypothetical protein